MSMLPVGFGASGDYTIEESLRFNASQSSYLSWTPASTGNRKTWTWSGWVKRGGLGVNVALFGAYTSSATNSEIFFNSDDKLHYWSEGASTVLAYTRTDMVFRDTSAWYHIVVTYNSTEAVQDDRLKIYVNGSSITYTNVSGVIGLNEDSYVNDNTRTHALAYSANNGTYFDGYLTEVNFIDGQALDASSFGEFDATTGVWKPKGYTGTYGTNGFYLPMKLDNTVEGFNTVTYLGTGSKQQITGVGFSPDLVWIKRRNATYDHDLFDSVRGAGLSLYSSTTAAEGSGEGQDSFDTDGFTVSGNHNRVNVSGGSFVAWCWDAGSSTVSNTNGSITSSVRANPTYGFSVVTYTGNGTSGATVGHSLGAVPSMYIIKSRDVARNWLVHHSGLTAYNYTLNLNDTSAQVNNDKVTSAPTSQLLTFSASNLINGSGEDYVAYCFSEVSGYSKFGSYSGTGASGNTVTTGFKPAFVLIKRTDTTGNWVIHDNTRDSVNPINAGLYPNTSDAENTGWDISFTDTGFTLDTTGTWENASGGTYIYMAFKDTREYAFWLDDSGNNNDWQPNGGITTESTVTDTPTPYLGGGNYAVLNPLNTTNGTLSQGNLQWVSSGGVGYLCTGTMAFNIADTSNKYYFEFTLVSGDVLFGIAPTTLRGSDTGRAGSYGYYTNGNKYIGTSPSSYGASFTVGDIIGVAVGAGKVTFYKNGVSQGDAFTGLTGYFVPMIAEVVGTYQANFGQRPFAYTPPTGFKALHTGNLPDSTIVDGSKHFDVLTWSGDGTSPRSLGNLEFQPDFVWGKVRNNTFNHWLYDSVRGTSLGLKSNATDAEITNAVNGYVSAFNSDGFDITAGTSNTANLNGAGGTYVGWNWKANGTGVSNTDGSITSTVSANPTAGFSIVTYTGTGANATVGHGLGVAPSLIIAKTRSLAAKSWPVYSKEIGAGKYLVLNSTNGSATDTNMWQNTTPTSSVFNLGTDSWNNGASATYIAYCFAEVEGYSRISSFVGNGSTDGVFVYTGFRPAFVLIKRTDVLEQWHLLDGKRDPYNYMDNELYANLSNAEAVVGSARIDFVSNGIKIRTSNSGYNASGGTYIYMAFAESPFKVSLAR